jgi:[acyl-carrier-protein] S-malonyltransferase
VELGNGNVLRGLMKRIDKRIKVYSLSEPDDVAKLPGLARNETDEPAAAAG